MELLSALGLAGNVVQFSQFALELFSKSKEIYDSRSGISADSEHLERICTKLQDFIEKFTQQDNPSTSVGSTAPTSPSNPEVEIREVVKACKEDCEKLLEITASLRTVRRSKMKAWRSFSDALKEVTKATDIKRLKGRIKESQDIIVIGMLAMSRFVFPYISAPYYLRDVPYWSFTYLTKNFCDI